MKWMGNLGQGTAYWGLTAILALTAFLLGILATTVTTSTLARRADDPNQGEVIRNLPVAEGEPWDSRDIRRASIILDGCLYRMWYAGTDSSHRFRIGYALSEDGIRWIRFPSNPVLEPGEKNAWDGHSIWDPTVVITPEGYKMWYVGQDSRGRTRIGLAESRDGIEWLKCPCNPVLDFDPGLDWEGRGVLQPLVVFDGNRYRMWYVGDTRDSNQPPSIGYAISVDGRVWEKGDRNPILTPDPKLDWERDGVTEPAVIQQDALFHMWYVGIDENGTERINHATSVDGMQWNRSPANPVLSPMSVETWESKGVLSPSVLFADGFYHLWYFGSDIKSDGRKVRIGYCTSPTGMVWVRHEGNPVFGVSSGGRYQNP